MSFAAFHDDELVEHSDATLASDFFEDWASSNPTALPLSRNQCVGYRIPLFLGGKDTNENLEIGDVEVYWTICGQLRAQRAG